MRASTTSCGPGLILVVAAWLCLPATGRPDVPLPDVPPFDQRLDIGELIIEEDEKSSPPLPLRLETDDDSLAHRIVIPASVLAKLAGVPLRARHTTSISTTRSVAAGVALSAALGFGFVAYRRGRAARIAAVMLVGLAAAGGGALVSPARADIPLGRPELFVPVPQPREVVDVVTLRQGAKVILELADADDETIVIVLGKKAVPAK